MEEKFKIKIDGQTLEVAPGTTIMEAARAAKGCVAPPAMCYYSSLEGSGGKCRTCLVKVSKGSDKDPRPMPKLVPGCKTLVMDGMEVLNTSSPEVVEARKGVVEMLLINHPLDCPICDQAGECKLQDLSYEHGRPFSRYQFPRNTYASENIGDKIQLNKNRCILCYRCILLADQLTPERKQGVLFRGDHAEISTYMQSVVENSFCGNMIDVCPVGALTDKTFRFKQRVWFTNPQLARRDCEKCCGEVVLWLKGENVLRVTARRDNHNEVKKFICNECRFEKKELAIWTLEGPANIPRSSVISVNFYNPPAIDIVAPDEPKTLKC